MVPRKVNIEIHNPTSHDIILGRPTPLGSLHLVQSITPLKVQRKDLSHPMTGTSTEEDDLLLPKCESRPVSQEQGVDPRTEETGGFVRTPPVKLGNLTEEQRQMAIVMLQEEGGVICKR